MGKRHTRIIGVTGGVGCGKSEILSYLKKTYKCRVLLADLVAKQMQEPGSACYGELVSLLGRDVLDEMGNILKPDYLSTGFASLLEKNDMRHIRFHDLRHTCASLLLKNGVPMKQIQEWLGHSDFSTTANIYAHLDFNSKLDSAQAMVMGMSGALTAVS